MAALRIECLEQRGDVEFDLHAPVGDSTIVVHYATELAWDRPGVVPKGL